MRFANWIRNWHDWQLRLCKCPWIRKKQFIFLERTSLKVNITVDDATNLKNIKNCISLFLQVNVLVDKPTIPWYAKPTKFWNVKDVNQWLEKAGMANLRSSFTQDNIDGISLMRLARTSKANKFARQHKIPDSSMRYLQIKISDVLGNPYYCGGTVK